MRRMVDFKKFNHKLDKPELVFEYDVVNNDFVKNVELGLGYYMIVFHESLTTEVAFLNVAEEDDALSSVMVFNSNTVDTAAGY